MLSYWPASDKLTVPIRRAAFGGVMGDPLTIRTESTRKPDHICAHLLKRLRRKHRNLTTEASPR